ncbi:hypothetical protein CDO52_25920 [Nocardiopsis gilva YIM 90087]|uniref:Uncharacterized protein n=1 Tax=Nocardiopsis gilva YIM 90087 TaxID=1235441 RepID=A0A223SCF2_9ACTN|nr:hypothetical protein [Nocardiopsis gilva]ASU85782.1 hypothetical protein CDO52_25920 [Nocardiopsis gilva YIM 90087]
MVLADWRRRGVPACSVCPWLGRTLVRLGAVAGIAAAGWLLAGSTASYADEAHSENLHEMGRHLAADVAGSAERTAQDGKKSGASATADVTRDVLPVDLSLESTTAALSAPVNSTTETAGTTTRTVVKGAARETGGVLSGTVRTGQKLTGYADSSLRRSSSSLTTTVSKSLTGKDGLVGENGLVGEEGLVGKKGLAETTGHLTSQLGKTIGGAPRAGDLPLLSDGNAPTPRSTGLAPGSAPDNGNDAPLAEDERGRKREHADVGATHPLLTRHATADAAEHVATFAAEAPGATGVHDRDAEDTENDGHVWHGGVSDSTSTSAGSASSSSWTPTPATPGFLMNRADVLRVPTQRVALPGDPTLVAREIADDPSFSPD